MLLGVAASLPFGGRFRFFGGGGIGADRSSSIGVQVPIFLLGEIFSPLCPYVL